MNTKAYNLAARAILKAMLGGDAWGVTQQTLDAIERADTEEWRRAVHYAKVALDAVPAEPAATSEPITGTTKIQILADPPFARINSRSGSRDLLDGAFKALETPSWTPKRFPGGVIVCIPEGYTAGDVLGAISVRYGTDMMGDFQIITGHDRDYLMSDACQYDRAAKLPVINLSADADKTRVVEFDTYKAYCFVTFKTRRMIDHFHQRMSDFGLLSAKHPKGVIVDLPKGKEQYCPKRFEAWARQEFNLSDNVRFIFGDDRVALHAEVMND